MSAKPVTIDLPLQVRAMALGNADAEKRTVDIVWSTGSRVVRYDWLRDEQFIEELSLEPKHVRMERLRSGAPLLDSHMRHSLASQIGVVERAQVDGKQGTATVRFSKRAEVEPIFQDVIDGVIRNVSVGYRIHKVEKTRDEPSGLTVLRAIGALGDFVSTGRSGRGCRGALRRGATKVSLRNRGSFGGLRHNCQGARHARANSGGAASGCRRYAK